MNPSNISQIPRDFKHLDENRVCIPKATFLEEFRRASSANPIFGSLVPFEELSTNVLVEALKVLLLAFNF